MLIASRFNYATNMTYADFASRLAAARRIMITTHAKPDGDAMGSTLALARALTPRGKQADLFYMGPMDSNLLKIAHTTPYTMVEHRAPADDYDLVVVTDTGAWSQLEPLAEWLGARREITIGLDHHSRGDDVASGRIVEPKAVSCTALVMRLLDEMNVDITNGVGSVAEALFVGLATDSGWFRYGNAGPEAFDMAARLLHCGVDKSRLYQILEETHPPRRLALEGRALASLQFEKSGSVAIQSLRPEDFTATGGAPEDLTGIVNTPMTVSQVRVSILFVQTELGLTKVSFRSKAAPPDGDPNDFIDVNALAAKFGGGGHVHAAGARLKMDLDSAMRTVIAAL